MSNAILGRGAKFQVESAVPGVYTSYPEPKEITPPNPSSDEIDVTNQDSPGRTKELIAGAIDYGEASFNGNYIPSNVAVQQAIADASSGNQITRNYRILFPGGARSIDFAGWIKGIPRTFPVSGVMEITVNVRCTGLPIENPAP